jgi:glycosyltransferase involved in cell wall biosynthesis
MLISIIISTLNEAEDLPATLASLRRQMSDTEIIVCDGGSTGRLLRPRRRRLLSSNGLGCARL